MNSDIFGILTALQADKDIERATKKIRPIFGYKKTKRTKGKRDKSLKIRANRRK